MRKINPEHIKSLIGMLNHGPYYQLLDMRLCAIEAGFARVEVMLSRKHLNPFGAVHGGAYSSMLDTAAYWAAYCELDENVGLTTVDLSTNFLAMATEGLVTIEGYSIKVGRSLCLTQAFVRDESGKLLAYGTSQLMVLQGRQTINDAISTMGFEALPPKFLD